MSHLSGNRLNLEITAWLVQYPFLVKGIARIHSNVTALVVCLFSGTHTREVAIIDLRVNFDRPRFSIESKIRFCGPRALPYRIRLLSTPQPPVWSLGQVRNKPEALNGKTNPTIPGTESPGSYRFFIYLRPAKNAKKYAVTRNSMASPISKTVFLSPLGFRSCGGFLLGVVHRD